ncbi:MAG: hypothetical protein K8S16_19815 [Bacteroidales bacterium]|nr:hypothetical protein [Bacteroidales bacterium]
MKTIKHLMGYFLVTLLFMFAIQNTIAQTNKKVKVNKNTFGAIEARHIGPATMSGRIASLDAVQKDPRIIYAGTASGGLWKSVNGGVKFKAIFDKYNQSIGAVTIDQQRPDTVWIGTGEVWTRNSVSVGDGIYKTHDGGENWEKSGLKNTERIGRIFIHPHNPNIIFVAALGHLWNSNEERGVYKTTDGGKNWEKILYVDENTGCADLAMDPSNPDILYAAMWEFRRYPYYFNSGGPGSGLYISRNGGESWDKITDVFPNEELGRIAVSISPVDPNIVYALVESDKSTLYRSKDKGNSWEKMNDEPNMGHRPFYFSLIVADPVDTNRVYKPGYSLVMSENGGKNFRGTFVTGGRVHGDFHALWISKKDNHLMYLGTDGGLYISNDQGSSWRFIRNLPVSQFYHVAVDNQKPYNVYGGLQDNGSWVGPSKSPGGIQNRNWNTIGWGDGFYVWPDPYDDNIVYGQWQGGNLYKKYRNTLESKDIKPFEAEGEEKLRWNWNTAVALSPTRDVLYIGSQYLFKSEDKGESWKRISPDLTTNDPKKQKQEKTGGITIDNSTAENHCSIYTISESPKDNNMIWVGTDDGNLQVTKNGGDKWINVIGNVPDLPKNTWVSCATASRYDAGTAYVTFDGHRTGNMISYLYKTTDYGKSWIALVDDNVKGWCYKMIEDTENPNLLFLGTELGLFVSIDGGEVWSQFKGDLPNVSVRDLTIQERESDLVLGTHGRGIMIIDDLTPLRQLTEDILQQDVAFLESKPYKLGYLGWAGGLTGDDEFVGSNPYGSSIITYYLKKRHVFGDMFIEIYNEAGEKVKEMAAGKRKGINRIPWRMRMKPPKVPRSPLLSFRSIYGPTYPPGEYTVKIIKGDKTYEGKINVVYDETIPHSIADRDARMELVMDAYTLLEDLGFLDKQVTEIRDQAKVKAAKANNKSLSKKLNTLSDKMKTLHKELVATTVTNEITGEEKLREKIADIYSSALGFQGKPTQSQIDRLSNLKAQAMDKRETVDIIINKQLPQLNEELTTEGIEPFKLTTKEEFLEENK